MTVRIFGAQESSQKALNLIPICIFILTGVEMHLTSKTLPDEVDLQLFLTSIGLLDPRATHSVRSINKDLPQGMKV